MSIKRYIVGSFRPHHALSKEPDTHKVEIELTDEEYADYRIMIEAYERWQIKLVGIYGT